MIGMLSLITFSPLLGVAALLGLQATSKPCAPTERHAKWIALGTTLVTFLLSLVLTLQFNRANPGFQFVEDLPWFAGLHYRMGVDGISILFVLLTTFLLPLCIASSWTSVEKRIVEYLIAFLVLETLVIGVFCALDIVLFYLFFEGGLVPMFLIIGIWGGKRRVYAAYKFFLYTLLGSVLMLAAILAMIGIAHSSSVPELMQYKFEPWLQTWLWLAFFASFAVKMPMWPVHTWLPDAHVEAPTAGSVILAGILLKMGGYGFLRFSLPMFPAASMMFQPLVFTLSVIAIIYTSLVAFRQTDMKKLIAYSSVAHMGFVTMGIFSGNAVGEQGAIYQMLSHGCDQRGAVPLRWRCLRSDAYPRDRLLRRPDQSYALVRGRVPALHHGQCGPAGHQWFRRGNPDHDRDIPSLDLGGAVRRDRCDLLGRLCPDALSPGDVRYDYQSGPGRDQRSGLARSGDLHATYRCDPGAGSAAGLDLQHYSVVSGPFGRQLARRRGRVGRPA